VIDAGGAVVDVVPQPADVTTCTLVLQAPGEIAAAPWAISPEEGVQIAAAILALWALGWGAGQVARVINLNEEGSDHA
jgi:hypothetical protein